MRRAARPGPRRWPALRRQPDLLRRWLRLLPPCEPGLLLYDTFAGLDGTSLDLRRIGPLSPPGVEAWSQAAGDWEVCAGRASIRTAGGCDATAAFVPLDCLDARVRAALTGGCRSAAPGHDTGLHVRFGGLPETCLVGYNDRAGVFRIVQTRLGPDDAPVETILASARRPIHPHSEHVIEAVVQGERLRATLDGVLCLTVEGLVTPPYANGFGLRLSDGGAACREFKVYRV